MDNVEKLYDCRDIFQEKLNVAIEYGANSEMSWQEIIGALAIAQMALYVALEEQVEGDDG